ncbi:YlaF family protein [Staphylococcus pseudintermedius]|nr:YlaF family protein [Staphylococcus pseudintermedius]EJY3773108.1 YlaF family protein [Staphylococcus pseudintermedius]ELI4080379.1 YlaF family protein [Staphylococcus pseudintermedius]ELK4502564.1 YlaF family protein [Staphylococcus pseudintermedius]ELV2888807.1 YlaF family protein [Staphylococcus pseudintermedius]
MKKSQSIFLIFAIIAVFFLTMFSFAVAATNIFWMTIMFILMVVTFGVGFTLKKKYRENDWL